MNNTKSIKAHWIYKGKSFPRNNSVILTNHLKKCQKNVKKKEQSCKKEAKINKIDYVVSADKLTLFGHAKPQYKIMAQTYCK